MTQSTLTEFADGVADVIILGPIARIDFFVLRPPAGQSRPPAGQSPEAGGQPDLQRIPAFTIAMPVEAFANAVSILENVRTKLLESGVLRAGGSGSVSDNTVRHKPVSPNFNLER